MNNITDLDGAFDFGFTTLSDNHIAAQTDDKAMQMYHAILPLLNNLAKDSDKNAYIHWPNRAEKILQFKNKLQEILDVQ